MLHELAHARHVWSWRPFCNGLSRAVRITTHAAKDRQQYAADPDTLTRRMLLAGAGLVLPGAALAGASFADDESSTATTAGLSKYEPMTALKGKDYGKSRMTYKDYTMTASGLQFQDLRMGEGDAPSAGDTCIIDWDGYTIGYYGRPFEARNKPKGSSFAGDKDYYRFVLGSNTVIPAFEEAVAGMKVGGIRRIIVPVELGYPQEGTYSKKGPPPSNFAGQRALSFVLENRGMIDKTLLFDIELVRVDRARN